MSTHFYSKVDPLRRGDLLRLTLEFETVTKMSAIISRYHSTTLDILKISGMQEQHIFEGCYFLTQLCKAG